MAIALLRNVVVVFSFKNRPVEKTASANEFKDRLEVLCLSRSVLAYRSRVTFADLSCNRARPLDLSGEGTKKRKNEEERPVVHDGAGLS